MKVLSLEQMNKLKELGVDVSNASMCYISIYPYGDLSDGIVPVSKDFDKNFYNEFGDVFTLQDIIELLPDTIEVGKNNYYYLILQKETNAYYHCVYENLDLEILHRYRSSTMIESAYQMLLWVIENGYLKTK